MFARALSFLADAKYLEQINMIKVLCWDYNPICGSWVFWHFSISLEIFRQSVKGIIVYRIVRYQFIREHYTPTLILVFELKPLKTVVVCRLITGFKSVWSIMTPDTWNEQDFQFFFSSRCLVSDKSLRHVCFHVPHRWLRCMIPKKGILTKTWKAAERRLSEFNQSSALMRKRKIRVASVTLRDAWIQMRGKRYYHVLIIFYLSIRRLKNPPFAW